MKVAPVYRTVLKHLRRACRTRPHFVQDVRFLLSLPLFSYNEKHTVVPGTTVAAAELADVAIDACATQSTAAEDREKVSVSASRATLDNYLQRSASACYPIHTDTLFALCYADLQSAVRQPTQSEGGVNPIAQQMLRYRNLLWLKGRLERVLSDKTSQQLATSLSVANGPDESDFIPDDFFEDRASSQRSGKSIGDSTENTDNGGAAKSNADSTAASSTFPSNSNAGGSRFGAVVSAASDEADPDVVHSAGAIGQQGEMFVLRHRESFPMAAQFLSGFPTVPAAELASCAHQQAALVRLVREKYPTTVTCEDASVSLSLAVEPFDLQYRSREHAGLGYFATAHRQFRVRFSMEPLTVDEERVVTEKTEVLMVNSYFARLDMEAMQVVEEVGYLHSRDVLRMLRERDYGDHFSDYVGSAVAEALGDGEAKPSENTVSAKEAKSREAGSKNATQTPQLAARNAREFSLYFVNPTDAPMVLKGMLYYKLGKRSQLANTPIRCIPFGFLLLEA